MPLWCSLLLALVNAVNIIVSFSLDWPGVAALLGLIVFSVVTGIRLEERYGEGR